MTYTDRRPGGPGGSAAAGGPGMMPVQGDESKSSISVLRQRLWTNYFRLNFEYYIDFSDKQKQILKETAVSLLISLLSIMVVMINLHGYLSQSYGREEVIQPQNGFYKQHDT